MEMKNISLTFIVLLCLVTSIFSQKCKSELDPISGENRTIFTDKNKKIRFEYKKGGEIVDFKITFLYPGEYNETIKSGAELIFKLNNGEVLNLKSVEDAFPEDRKSSMSLRPVGVYIYSFNLTKKEIKKLSSSNIIFYSIPSPDGESIDFFVKGVGKAYFNQVKKGAVCISEQFIGDF